MSRCAIFLLAIMVGTCTLLMPVFETAGQETDVKEKVYGDAVLLKKTAAAGVDYLLEKGQAADGSFSKEISPAITALCISALIEHDISLKDDRVAKGLAYLQTLVQDDGGIYGKGSNLRNYETSVSIMWASL